MEEEIQRSTEFWWRNILEDNEESMAILKQILGKEFYNLNSHIKKKSCSVYSFLRTQGHAEKKECRLKNQNNR
jgi:hypothetical protein